MNLRLSKRTWVGRGLGERLQRLDLSFRLRRERSVWIICFSSRKFLLLLFPRHSCLHLPLSVLYLLPFP
jgi:hypothetical protein